MHGVFSNPKYRLMNEDVIACDVINPDLIDTEFESIGGLEAIKQALYELVILSF
ncbi:hypothetical protein J1N35_008470 [Gossypium stocksii]|uniref:Uncharacterized protein n=1 Tax=Gossypium stocksii TaxID=47602 RepID=A0A9D4AEH2_9ROSI|nr:hypothetical protein J1N35_008470 [Gossypium stocksii]